MFNSFFGINIQGRQPYLGDFMKGTSDIGLLSDTCQPISFKLGVMVNMTTYFDITSSSFYLLRRPQSFLKAQICAAILLWSGMKWLYMGGQAALAGTCVPYGGWPHPKRHSLWRFSIWKENQRPPTAVLQGCLQERHESTWYQHWVLGGPCSRPHDVEKHSEPTPQVKGREAGECRSSKKGLQKGAQQL